MAEVLSFDRLRSVPMRAAPAHWLAMDESFARAQAAHELTENYPDSGFDWPLQRRILDSTSHDAGRYRTSSRPFLRSLDPAMAGYRARDERVPSPQAGISRVVAADSLAPIWRRFADDLLSDEYREVIGERAHLDLSNAPLQADFDIGECGSWYHAHRDRGRRAVSHVFYFNPIWDPAWGGGLRVLACGDIDAVIAEIAPVSGTSVVMVHRGELWHGTLPLRRPDIERRSLHVWFWA